MRPQCAARCRRQVGRPPPGTPTARAGWGQAGQGEGLRSLSGWEVQGLGSLEECPNIGCRFMTRPQWSTVTQTRPGLGLDVLVVLELDLRVLLVQVILAVRHAQTALVSLKLVFEKPQCNGKSRQLSGTTCRWVLILDPNDTGGGDGRQGGGGIWSP